MVILDEVYERLARSSEPLATTGVKDLDHWIQGIRPGEVWVLTGAPRHGRTMIAMQLARRAAATGHATRILAGADSLMYYGALLGAGFTGGSLLSALHNWPSFERSRQAVESLDAARRLPIDLTTLRHSSLNEALRVDSDFLVLDDADLWAPSAIDAVHSVSTWAGESRAAVVTVPRHLVGPDQPDWQRWVRLATVVLQVELGAGDDLGAWFLRVLSNRHGPVGLVEAGALCAQARCVDLGPA